MAMKKIATVPFFMVGQVIDLSYKSGGNPNRARIEEIFFDSNSTEWKYKIQLESNDRGVLAVATESFLRERLCHTYADVYKKKVIRDRYNDGWRWAGNFPADTAGDQARLIAAMGNVKNVRLTEAYDGRGNLQTNATLAVWIRYNNVINANGEYVNGEYEQICMDVK